VEESPLHPLKRLLAEGPGFYDTNKDGAGAHGPDTNSGIVSAKSKAVLAKNYSL
jgi:hypothetical protein